MRKKMKYIVPESMKLDFEWLLDEVYDPDNTSDAQHGGAKGNTFNSWIEDAVTPVGDSADSGSMELPTFNKKIWSD